MKAVRLLTILAAMALCGDSSPVAAQEWTRFRGPNGTGESEATTTPATWTSEDYNWNVKLPGLGHSSPVVWGNQVFLLSADPETATRYVLSYDATLGTELWNRSFESTPHHLHKQSSYASSTPAVDANRVYVAWSDPASVTLMALSHQGEILWKSDLGRWYSQHGFGTSPMLVDDLVVLSNSQEAKDGPNPAEEPQSFMMAFDAATGEERWRIPRNPVNTSYAVPALFEPKNRPRQIVSMSTGDGMFGLDPRTGKEIWFNKCFDKRTVSSPLVMGDMIFGGTGSGGGGSYVVALRSDGTDASLAYKFDAQAPYVPTVVARGDLLFLVSDGGVASCIDLKTAKVHWRQRIGGNYNSSPVRAHDKLYCLSQDGEVVVLAAEKEFAELGRVSLGEGSRATPAIANGTLFLRTFSHLMSVGGPNGKRGER
ncbi:PQQ-binding-like beta-propeller repeat protein [Schlesneria sp. T3-172]|uniref:outer membrane protein assembly factor BamB family protein n=1 Tax=Schlesneria sphaerica TaxID=3373610 RepID=UPI0037CA9F44